MLVPLSWLKDFVDIPLNPEELAQLLTMLGLEVDSIRLVGLPMPEADRHEFKYSGLSWDPETLVVAEVTEVNPHPNADRLVLCQLNDGQQFHTVLTGAPNLFPYKGQGPLAAPLKVAYAKEGARIYDGHQPGQVLTTLKRTKIRGVESYSMVCSEKELGISDEHEGIILLDPDAPTGVPLADYLGDAVFEISILQNMARNANVVGIAREIAAATGQTLRMPPAKAQASGPAIQGKARIEIRNPGLNPRFVLGLIQGVTIAPSPYRVQYRLRLAGMRPINNLVDATNYAMLELGEPLHAFDYDVLLRRAGGKAPTIITRTAEPGEHLTTLDGVERTLSPETELVTDTAGALSIAGVMGGLESEISDQTKNVLLEGASWNFINIRKTMNAQHLPSEAAYRFSRGVSPALAEPGVQLGLEYMRQWAGGEVAQGVIDNYPLPVEEPVVPVTPADVERLLGIRLTPQEIAGLLERLEFTTRIEDDPTPRPGREPGGARRPAVLGRGTVYAQPPAFRLDIGAETTGKADVIEEVARIYGYDRIPPTRLPDELPPQRPNPSLEGEERVRDLLTGLGLQEIITYRLTSPQREGRILPPGQSLANEAVLCLRNPITPERNSLRTSLLAAVLEKIEQNIRLSDRLAMYEIGPVFLPNGHELPIEPRRLAIALTGKRRPSSWDAAESRSIPNLDFYDLKGIVDALVDLLHLPEVRYVPVEGTAFHPGKAAQVCAGERVLGTFGELHPLVKERFDFGEAPVLGGEFDLDALLALQPAGWDLVPVPTFPPVLEDIAVIVDEDIPAAKVEEVIRQGGGKMLAGVRLFDIFHGEQVGAGKKSLAYSLTYQAPDRTLTDHEAASIRQRIIRRLEQDLGAKLRS